MRRLFWKIFFSFWLVMILIIVTNLLVTWVQAERFSAGEHSEHVAELAEEAVEAFEKGGITEYQGWRHRLYRKTEMKVMLLDHSYREVTGKPVHPELIALLQGRFRDYRRDHDDDHRSRPLFKRHERPVTWQLANSTGERFTFVLLNPRQLSDHLYAKTTVLWRIGISSLIVTIIALLLSLYLVKPIRQLQATSRKLAEGNLASRVPKRLGQRKDELGELGRDFDTMAEKIEALIVGQQHMLRDVSHELRTPLARLRIALELARKRSGESPELDRMELEAERINALIDDILQLVRLNTAQQELHTERLPLCELLRDLAEDANLREERVSVRCEDGDTLKADRKLICRAIDNVIQNALKYSEGKITLSADREAEHHLIRIRDHGPGVKEEQLESLFSPFYRTDEARSRTTGGYGLGLAIAAQAVQAHQGQISARNHPEGGLEISIRLPLQ